MMPHSVQLSAPELELLKQLFKAESDVLIFGSRALGTARPFSDVDLCIRRKLPVPDSEMARFREFLQESGLPYLVDLVDYERLSDAFKKIIDDTGLRLKTVVPQA